MIIYLIGVILSILFSTISIFFTVKRYRNLKIRLLVILTFFFITYGIVFSILRYLILFTVFEESVVLFLWRISFYLLLFSAFLVINALDILDTKRLNYFLNLVIFGLSGYIISLTLLDETFNISIVIIDSSSYYTIGLTLNFFISELILLVFFLIKLNISFSYLLKLKMSKRSVEWFYTSSSLGFILILLIPIILRYIDPFIFSNFFLLINWIGVIIAFAAFIKFFNIFLSFYNIAYEFVVFHKSGIMLFNYDFEKRKSNNSSAIKGAVLIGINHILSEFSSAKDQITSIKLKNREIILEYNREYGFAILLIVNRRTEVFKKATQTFMEKFIEKYKEELKSYMDLNTAIDTLAFNDAKDILFKSFEFIPSLNNNRI